MKIKHTKKLTALLKDLVAAQQRFDRLTELLKPGADRDGREAVDIGSDRELVRRYILDTAQSICAEISQ